MATATEIIEAFWKSAGDDAKAFHAKQQNASIAKKNKKITNSCKSRNERIIHYPFETTHCERCKNYNPTSNYKGDCVLPISPVVVSASNSCGEFELTTKILMISLGDDSVEPLSKYLSRIR